MRSKYGNKPCVVDGIKFHSLLEGEFYKKCKAWKKEGKIFDFFMQKVFVLHGGIKYKLDFEIHKWNGRYADTGVFPVIRKELTFHFVEVKGFWTQTAKLKRKLFEADYGPLEIHSRETPWRP